jgi:hypothetical protein
MRDVLDLVVPAEGEHAEPPPPDRRILGAELVEQCLDFGHGRPLPGEGIHSDGTEVLGIGHYGTPITVGR